MTADEILAGSRVPNTKGLFVLGCLESRVTVFAQQVRALNLVDAIISQGLIRNTGRVAIIGGGAAGVTAAAAFALALPGAGIDIYERRHDLLHLQLKSQDRYLHPHIYDWPRPGSMTDEAGLPILNWASGTAGEVASSILRAFESVRTTARTIQVKTGEVERAQATEFGGCRISVLDSPHGGGFYDVAILSVGFGYERSIGEQNRAYWDPHPLSGPIRNDAQTNCILVSGNGDGGLVDFLTAAFQGLSHREICEFVTGYAGLEPAQGALLQIDEESWTDDSVDILQEYVNRVLPILPAGLLISIAEKLRPAVKVLLHTREPRLFRRDTSILNRFTAFLAIKANEIRFGDSISVLWGTDFLSDPLAETVQFNSGEVFTPRFRFLRFGADIAKNLSPFFGQIAALRTARGPDVAGFRPATPALTDSASSRFSAFSGVYGAITTGATPATDAVATGISRLSISSLGSGSCEWAGDSPIEDVAELWKDGSALRLSCDFPVGEAGPLGNVVARLVAHASGYELRCHDSHPWGEYLCRFLNQGLPGPDVDVKFRVLRPGVQVHLPHTEVLSCEAVATRVHASLDLDVLKRLHTELHGVLASTPRRQFGWEIEPGLRSRLLEKWNEWYAQLDADPPRRRRFLVGLSCFEDEVSPAADRLVAIGPKIIRPHLLRATVLALAFGVAVAEDLVPISDHPGNLRANTLTAHASGVAWLNGKDLGPDVAAQHWTTGFVLLSELQTSAALVKQGVPRLDHYPDETLRLGNVAKHERPIIIGADHDLKLALSHGRGAVADYVKGVVHDRAASAAVLIEPS